MDANMLRQIIRYDPSSGDFIWLISPRPAIAAGSLAGNVCDTGRGKFYRRITFRGERHFAHRLAYLYMTGEWPREMIDHRDNNGLNNAWENLRAASTSQNMANRQNRPNSLGLRGVRKNHKTFAAQISVNGKNRFLGTFASAEEAHAAYCAAAKFYFGEFRWA